MRPGFILLLLATILGAGKLCAQRSNGYIFFAPGGVNCCGEPTAMTIQAGFGGEYGIGKGIGVGAELSALGTRRYLLDSVVGVFSPNAYYHFVHQRDSKFDPFVTAGYSMMFRAGHANLFNFGAGVHYWFTHGVGLRLEFRDHVLRGDYNPTLNYWGFRFGLVF